MFGIIKFIFRVVGFLALAAAILTGISDASRSIAESQFVATPLGQIWFDLAPASLNLSQAVIQRYVHPSVWDPAVLTALTWPAWAVFAGVGLFFLWAGARRQKRRMRFA